MQNYFINFDSIFDNHQKSGSSGSQIEISFDINFFNLIHPHQDQESQFHTQRSKLLPCLLLNIHSDSFFSNVLDNH